MDKRKRAAVLALLALFCTAAATYVAVDWKGVSGGFAAIFKGKDDDRATANRAVAAAALTSSMAVAKGPAVEFMPQDGPPNQPEVALLNTRHRVVASVGGGGGSFKSKSEDDLFKDGDPAAGVPSGKFIVAQNDAPAAPDVPAGPPIPGGAAGVTTPAPAPTGNGGAGGGGVLQTTPTVSAVPEASSLAMMGVGALLLATVALRRRNQA